MCYLGEANGLCHVLTVACPKPRPTMWDLSPQTRDKWEIDRSELEFIRKLGSGNFGEVWYGKCILLFICFKIPGGSLEICLVNSLYSFVTKSLSRDSMKTQ